MVAITIEVCGYTRGKQASGCYSERATKVDHASDCTSMKDVKTVLEDMRPLNATKQRIEHTHCMVFFYRQLKVDGSRLGRGHTDL